MTKAIPINSALTRPRLRPLAPYVILILFLRETHSNHARCVFQNQSPISLAPTRPRLVHIRYLVLSPIYSLPYVRERFVILFFHPAWPELTLEKRVTCVWDACAELASGATLRVQKKSPGWGTIQGIFKMRRVAPRVAPKLKVLIPIKPAGATTKSTYVGAGAGALVRIDWIGFTIVDLKI